MNPVRAVIADDEPLARERIRTLLSRFYSVMVVGEAVTGRRHRLFDSSNPECLYRPARAFHPVRHGSGLAVPPDEVKVEGCRHGNVLSKIFLDRSSGLHSACRADRRQNDQPFPGIGDRLSWTPMRPRSRAGCG